MQQVNEALALNWSFPLDLDLALTVYEFLD